MSMSIDQLFRERDPKKYVHKKTGMRVEAIQARGPWIDPPAREGDYIVQKESGYSWKYVVYPESLFNAEYAEVKPLGRR
jgi:hypothetical protein